MDYAKWFRPASHQDEHCSGSLRPRSLRPALRQTGDSKPGVEDAHRSHPGGKRSARPYRAGRDVLDIVCVGANHTLAGALWTHGRLIPADVGRRPEAEHDTKRIREAPSKGRDALDATPCLPASATCRLPQSTPAPRAVSEFEAPRQHYARALRVSQAATIRLMRQALASLASRGARQRCGC